jgi:MFS transporter, DHA2 family, methylenomycin A resistance protein
VLVGVLAPLNSMMIVVALPELLRDLDVSLAWGSWLVLSYLVAMAAVQPIGGSLGDRFGRRALLLTGMATFALASLVAALAPTIGVLLVARTVQALAGAIAIPNGTALVRLAVPRSAQGQALGVVAAGIGVAAALGPPLGGIVTELAGWRWIFAVNLVVLLPAFALAWGLPRAERSAQRPFDLAGAALLLVTLVGGAVAATLWRVLPNPLLPTLGFTVGALLSGFALVVRSRRVPTPVVDLELFARPGYLAAGIAVMTNNLAMYTVLLAIPILLTGVAGWTPRDVGLLLAALSVPMLALGPLGGRLSDRLGRRVPAVAGALLTLLGLVVLVALSYSAPPLALGYVVALALIGAGVGLAGAPVHAAALEAARDGEVGAAAGLHSTMRYVGSITGSALLVALLGDAPAAGGFTSLFIILVAASLVAAVSSSRLPARTETEATSRPTLERS